MANRNTMKPLMCRECGQNVTGTPYINLGVGTSFKGGNMIHLSCAERIKRPSTTLLEWTVEYINSHKDPLYVARNKIKDLEARLAMAQQTIKDLEFQQSRRNG